MAKIGSPVKQNISLEEMAAVIKQSVNPSLKSEIEIAACALQ